MDRRTPSPSPPDPAGLPFALLRVTALPFESLEPLRAVRTVALLDRRAALREELDATAAALADALFAAAGPPEPEAGAAAARARLAVVALRRAVFNHRDLRDADRERAGERLSPELAGRLDAYRELLAELGRLATSSERAFEAELLEAREALRRQLSTPAFEAAVRLVSRSLRDRLRALGEAAEWRHDERHAAAKLAAYLDRAATKTSPNGLFCATAAITWARRGEPAKAAGENRFDHLEFLLNVVEARKIAACLGSEPALWPALAPRVNPTLREEDGAWTFWRPASLSRQDNQEILRRLKRHPVAEVLVELARPATRTVPELLAATAETTGAAADDLAVFFSQLADAGLLSGEIEIPYTCRRPLAELAATVRNAGLRPPWLDEVEVIEREVENLASLPPGPRIEAMDRIAHRLDALPHTRPLETDELFRVDAASSVEVTLPAEIPGELRGAVGAYARFFARLYPRRALHRGVARSFLETHGADRDVSLLDLYRSSPLGDGGGRPLGFPEPPSSGSQADGGRQALERARSWFASEAESAAEEGREEVEITTADWDHLAGPAEEPPWAAGVLFQVAAASAADLAAGRWRLAINDIFTGAGLALARFAHLHAPADPHRANPIVEELRRESGRLARPAAVLAEVTYNHWGRAANAGLRQPFLEHEIELPGELASPGATAIPLAELTLRWSSEENRLVLRWPRRGVEVVPVITSGVAPEGFVSLLVAIGRQAIQPLSYFPGFEVEGVRRWPRFTCGRVVLFRRRWIFPSGSYPEPATESGDPDALLADFFARLHRWRRGEGLPRHLFVATSAEPKPFHQDLESPVHTDLLRHRLWSQTHPTLYLTEMLPGPEEMWVRDEAGRYASEFLVQLGSGPRGRA